MQPIDPMFYLGMFLVSYAMAIYTWKDEKVLLNRIMKIVLTGVISIVSLMLFVWKVVKDPDAEK